MANMKIIIRQSRMACIEMTDKELILWGASGQAKVLAEFVPQLGYRIAALFDSKDDLPTPVPGVAVHKGMDGFSSWRAAHRGELHALIAIGGANGFDRLSIQRQLKALGVIPVTVVHPTAFVAASARLGEGSQILAMTAIGTEARLGEACIVNTGARIDHECRIGDGTHIAPGAVLAGCVELGNFVFVGPGAVITARCKVGDNVMVGAGAVVLDDVPSNTVVYGVPARHVRSLPPRQIPQ